MTHLDEFTLNEYLDGMLDAAAQAEAQAHLAVCGDCRAALAELQQLFTALAKVKELPLTADLSAQVLTEIAAEAEPETSAGWLRPLLLGQLLAAAAMLVWLWPVIGGWLQLAGTAVQTAVSQLQPIQFSLGTWLAGWGTAVLSQLQNARPALDLAANQWSLLLLLALALWLAGNRLLFINEQ